MKKLERNRIIDRIEKIGQSRAITQPDMHDADFLAGALAALVAMGMFLTDAPASWTLGLMFTGKSPLRPDRQEGP
jgi:hypothetical protein